VTVAQQERAIRTRKAILEAAAAVFEERGYEAATIAEILERAEVTKGALYFHFPSKEALAHGILEQAVTTEGIHPQELKLQEILDIMLVLAARMPQEPTLRSIMRLSVDRASRALVGTRWPEWTRLMADLVSDAKARGEIHQHVDPVGTARLLVCTWTGVQIVTDGLPEEYDLTAEIAALLQLLVVGLAVPSVLARLEISAERAHRLYAALTDTPQ
jgi:AcrR family transcriptional regulator